MNKITYPILSNQDEIINHIHSKPYPQTENLLCFFSSHLNAFITDPIFMNIPIEDKIINRGYSVFETTEIFGNKIYQLDKHISRFQKSINYINLKSNLSSQDIRNILINMSSIARSIEKNQDIELRYFYSAGVGNFSVVVDDSKHTFYAIALKSYNETRPVNGTNEYTVNINNLKIQASKSKNTNYLINAMTTKMSRDNGGYLGIMTDSEGNLMESPISNLAFYLNDGSFSVPPFDRTLAGTTVIRCLDFIENEMIPKKEILKIDRSYLNINDVPGKVKEAMLVGGDFVIPILSLNGYTIGSEPGRVARRLQEFLINDKKGDDSSEDVPVFRF